MVIRPVTLTKLRVRKPSSSSGAMPDFDPSPERLTSTSISASGEGSKSGVAPEELDGFLARSPVRVSGLMTMPPPSDDPEASRPFFARLRELGAQRGLERLSMGTTQDFGVAVEEGATIVRIGTRLYR